MAINREDIHLGVRYLTSKQLCIDGILVNLDADFTKDLDADSLDLVELVMSFEQFFNIEIPDEVAFEISTVGEAVDLIVQKLEEIEK